MLFCTVFLFLNLSLLRERPSSHCPGRRLGRPLLLWSLLSLCQGSCILFSARTSLLLHFCSGPCCCQPLQDLTPVIVFSSPCKISLFFSLLSTFSALKTLPGLFVSLWLLPRPRGPAILWLPRVPFLGLCTPFSTNILWLGFHIQPLH